MVDMLSQPSVVQLGAGGERRPLLLTNRAPIAQVDQELLESAFAVVVPSVYELHPSIQKRLADKLVVCTLVRRGPAPRRKVSRCYSALSSESDEHRQGP